MHDFAITEHYSLFLDFPFVFNPRRMMEVANGKRQKPFVFDGVRALARFRTYILLAKASLDEDRFVFGGLTHKFSSFARKWLAFGAVMSMKELEPRQIAQSLVTSAFATRQMAKTRAIRSGSEA